MSVLYLLAWSAQYMWSSSGLIMARGLSLSNAWWGFRWTQALLPINQSMKSQLEEKPRKSF